MRLGVRRTEYQVGEADDREQDDGDDEEHLEDTTEEKEEEEDLSGASCGPPVSFLRGPLGPREALRGCLEALCGASGAVLERSWGPWGHPGRCEELSSESTNIIQQLKDKRYVMSPGAVLGGPRGTL